MKKYLLGIAVLLVTPCLVHDLNGQDLEKKIHGTWVGDVELTKEYWKSNSLPEEKNLLKRVSGTSISFLKGGGLRLQVLQPGGKQFKVQGKYEVIKTDKEKKVIQLKFVPVDDGPEPVEVTVKVLESKKQITLAITPKNDPPIVFAQEKEQKSDKKGDSDAEKPENLKRKSANK